MLIVGRFINGICVGICSAQVPVYVAELAPAHKRGLVVGAQQWAITWGILIMFYISYGCSFLKGPASFRVPWALQMIPAIFLFFGIFWMPESPRWLAKQDRWDDCQKILALIHANNNPDDDLVRMELQQLREACHMDRIQSDVSFTELVKPPMLWRLHIGVFVQIWSQLTGINVIMYCEYPITILFIGYGLSNWIQDITFVFGMAGLSGNNNLVASSINYVINVVVTVPALLYLDKVGRRPILLMGSISLTVWWFLCAGLMGSYGSPAPPGGLNHIAEESWSITGAPAKVVIACSYLVVASFAPSWGPVSWVYPPELFPLRLRGKAVALSTASNWMFNFALSYFTPPAFVNIKWKTYLIFGAFSFAMALHVFFCFPETAGKTLEEVEGSLKENRAPWRAASNKRDLEDRAIESIQAEEKREEEIHVERA